LTRCSRLAQKEANCEAKGCRGAMDAYPPSPLSSQREFRPNPEIFANRLQKMLRSAATLGRRAVARGLASKRNASTLVLATHNNTSLNPSTLNTVTAASKIGGEVRLGHGALGIMGRFGISPQPGMSFAGSNEEAFEARGECIGRCAARTCMGKLWCWCRNAQQ